MNEETIALAKVIARETVLLVLQEQGIRVDAGRWVTVNYAVTHLIPKRQGKRMYGTGFKALSKAIQNKEIVTRKDGKIEFKSLINWLNR